MLQGSDKLVECLVEAATQYAPDGMPAIFDLQVEAEILGCELTWYKNTRRPPCPLIPWPTPSSFPERRLRKTDGRIPIILDSMRRFKQARPDIGHVRTHLRPILRWPHTCGERISSWTCTTTV